MLQNLGVYYLSTVSFLLLKMDIDGYIEDLINPLDKFLRELFLEDVFDLLGVPAKSLRVRDNLVWDLEVRKRAMSMIVLDFGTNSKYLFFVNVLLTF